MVWALCLTLCFPTGFKVSFLLTAVEFVVLPEEDEDVRWEA